MHKILVVDDDKALTKALSIRLRAAGFDVEVCNCAHDASGAVLQIRPVAIILDIDMPSYTGPEFHMCLQFSQRSRGIPIIYLSGHDTLENRRMAAQQGAVGFLTKPYDADELVVTLNSAIHMSAVYAQLPAIRSKECQLGRGVELAAD